MNKHYYATHQEDERIFVFKTQFERDLYVHENVGTYTCLARYVKSYHILCPLQLNVKTKTWEPDQKTADEYELWKEEFRHP